MAGTSNSGGPRPNSGRPRKAVPSEVVRLPVDLAEAARRMAAARNGQASGIGAFLQGEARTHATAPLISTSVACGFPSPAEDHLERRLDLNELHGIGLPEVILVRAAGDSMTGRKIFDGDVVIVNRAKEVRHGCIVVACLNGEFTMKTYIKRGKKVILQAENPAFANIEVPELAEFFIWGVVTGVTRVF